MVRCPNSKTTQKAGSQLKNDTSNESQVQRLEAKRLRAEDALGHRLHRAAGAAEPSGPARLQATPRS